MSASTVSVLMSVKAIFVGVERAAEVLLVGVEQLLDRAVDVHLVQQIEAAAQVEAERHGAQPQRLDPARRARRVHHRVDVFLGEAGLLVLDDVARP